MNGHPNIDTTEATEHLKNILNVGKSDPAKVKPVSATSMEPSGEAAFDNERPIFQRVELTGSEGNVCIYGTDVSVYPSPVHRSPSSCSNVMMYNIVDYSWEQKYHQGRLVSIHLSKKFMAYALKVPSSTGYVRVIKHSTNNHLLLKGFKGGAKDLSFAHSLTRILLGCIDEVGELHIYEILDEEPRIKARYCVHITRPINTPSSIYHRIVWCPYVPEDTIVMDNNGTSPDDVMMMTSLLIATHDEKAEVWNIDTVMKEYGQGEIPVEKVKNGMRLICEHKKPITAAAFSPDAIALATASLDGEVKFFQVNAQENDGVPKCVHKWTPHDGKPISSLFFLDNHKSYSPDVQFWKFAVTGANNNEELKLWSCKTWTCLQTIRMMSYDSDGTPPCIKADIDLSAGYIFLSDINRMVFYILKVSEAGTTNQTMISSLSEFPIKFPVLSFAVVDVAHCKRKMSFNAKNSADADDEEEEEDDEGERDEEEYDDIMRKYPYLVKLYWINTKSLQFCKILYSPKSSSPLQSVGSMSSSQDSFAYRDGLSDLSTDVPDQPNISSCETDINSNKSIAQTSGLSTVLSSQPALTTSAVASLAPHRSPSYQGCDEVLLTPKDFTSPHAPVPSASIANSYKLGGIQEVTSDITVTGEAVSESNISGVSSDQPAPPRRKSSQHSSTSSPSREVAEILSPNQILGHENEIESPKPKKEDEILSPPVGVHPDVICPSPVLNQMSQEYLNSEWPLAPDPPQEYRVPSRSESDIHRPHLPLEQSTRHAMQSLNGERISPNATPIDTSSQWLKRSIEALSLNLTSITDTLHCQSQAIQFIQQEIQELQQQHKYTQKDIRNIDALYNSLISKVEQVVSENSVSEFARVESLLSKHEDCEKQHLEQQSVALSQNLTTSMNKQMDKIIKQEMKNVVMPQMSKCVETLVENFQAEVLQKLNSTDNALKECVGKHLRSKVFSDNLAQAAANILQLSVQNACKDVFQSHVVVSLEKCCQLLFSQMNEVFSSGVAEYTGKLESYHQVMAANFEATANRFQEFAHRLAAEAQNLFMKISEKAQADAASINRQHELLLTRVRQTVQEEVRRAMAENASSIAAAVRSQTSTPAPQNDSQLSPQQLLHLARQGHINDAFQKALSAVDVKLVLFLCENVSVDKVFGPDCAPLAQHVLLSLINQLSGELSEKTEIKVRYIEDAITSLDQDDPVTKEHLGRVAGSLEQRASTFLKQNPNHPMARNVKRILMSINSFDLK